MKTKSMQIMELVAGYDEYAHASELQVDTVADAPETTLVCVSASSKWCASAIGSAVGTATYKLGC